MRSRLAALFVGTLAVACVVSACGQKGALYLPEKPQTEVPATGPVAAPSPPADPEDPEKPANRRTQ